VLRYLTYLVWESNIYLAGGLPKASGEEQSAPEEQLSS